MRIRQCFETRSIRDELEHVHRRFLSEMDQLPSPLRELVSRSKKGLNEDNVMLCVPFWMVDIFGSSDMLEVARTMSLANCYCTSYFLAQDKVIDHGGYNKNKLILNDVVYFKWISKYRPFFDHDSPFWTLFEKYLNEYSNSLYWEKKQHWGKLSNFSDEDLNHLGQKFSPIKISCTAMSIIGGREEYINDFSDILEHFHTGFQLKDDFIDWKEDLKAGNYTYFLYTVLDELGKLDSFSDIEEGEIEEAIVRGKSASGVLKKSSHYFLLAKGVCDRIGCLGFSDYLKRMVIRNEEMAASLSDKKKTDHHIQTINSRSSIMLYGRDLHEFSYGGKDYVFHVGSSKLFNIDELSEKIIHLSKNKRINDIFSQLSGKYPESAVQEALRELIREDIIGFEEEVKKEFKDNKQRRIKSLSLNITHRCNFRCIYCYGNGGSYGTEKTDMSREVAKRSVDFLMDNSDYSDDCSIILFGGEPLMNIDLVKFIVEYGKIEYRELQRRIKLSLVTNGSMLNDENIRYLNENDISVQISMDGPPKIQNYNRPFINKKGSYDEVVSRSKKLINSRDGRVSVRGTLIPDNSNLKEIVIHLAGLGFMNVHVEPASGTAENSFINPDDVEELKKQYTEFSDFYLEKIKKGERFGFSNLIRYIARIHYGGLSNYSCGAGKSFLAVSPDGSLYPCHRFVGDDSYRIGNVFDGITGGRDKFFECSVVNIPDCSDCWARYFCAGACLWESNLHNNSIFKPDPIKCDLIRHIIELAMKIYTQLTEDDKIFLREVYKLEGRPYINKGKKQRI